MAGDNFAFEGELAVTCCIVVRGNILSNPSIHYLSVSFEEFCSRVGERKNCSYG
jgi:hypothetical protein